MARTNPTSPIISRYDAAVRGLKFYFTGIPCKSGHTCVRYTRSRACRECAYAKELKYRTTRGRTDRMWASHLFKTYGITVEEYTMLLDAQDGVCAICKKSDSKRLSVDHSHTSGKVRGLLCTKCNTALGKFDDSVDLLNTAVEYLKERG